MPKYATFEFDPEDTQDQYGIAYNDYQDGSGDFHLEWFDTEEQVTARALRDINDGVVFLTKWESKNA